MDKELKVKWIGALRSGDYVQLTPGESAWYREGKHCCLGVLGEFIDPVAMRDCRQRTNLIKVAGLTENEIDELISMNDKQRLSFSQIADHVEKNL